MIRERRHQLTGIALLVALLTAVLLVVTATTSAPAAVAASYPSTMSAGDTLKTGDRLVSPNGAYRLVMQGDGNLVLYKGGSALWHTHTNSGGSRAVMQGDGNLVVYSGSTAKWNSKTNRYKGAELSVQDDGNLVIRQAGRAIWTRGSGHIGEIVRTGQVMRPGAIARSENGAYRLVMQGDGNFVLYKGGSALWHTHTNSGGSRAVMQGDGNLVVYSGSTAKWNSHTAGNSGAYLAVQTDGNLVIYRGGTAIWTRASGGGGGGGANPAATWAAAQVGQKRAGSADARLFSDWAPGPYGEWSGDCAKFVYAAWLHADKEIVRGHANDKYRYYKSRLRGGTPPAGALVFWPDIASPYGHVAIADGSGYVYTTQRLDGDDLPIARVPATHFGAPAGWVMP